MIFFEPKAVYRLYREEVPDEPEYMPLGKAQVARAGSDVTLISYGAMMRSALEAADDLKEEGVSAEVIDLLTVSPLDTETIVDSVKKTGRAVVIHEGARTCGVGAEVVARIVEKALWHLEAPIMRVTGFDVHFPHLHARAGLSARRGSGGDRGAAGSLRLKRDLGRLQGAGLRFARLP